MINAFFGSTNRISYRRLLAFATATGLLLADKLTSGDWVYVCVAFVAAEAGPKMMDSLSKVRNGS